MGGAKARDTFLHLLMRSAEVYCGSGTVPGAGPTAVTPTEIFTELLSSWGRGCSLHRATRSTSGVTERSLDAR